MSFKIIYNILQVISQKSTKQGQIKATQPSNTTQENVAQCISCTYNDSTYHQLKTRKTFIIPAYTSLYFIVLNLYSDLPPKALKNKLFSNSALLFTYAVFFLLLPMQVFFHHFTQVFMKTSKYFCLCLLTTSGITIIVSFVQENVLLL